MKASCRRRVAHGFRTIKGVSPVLAVLLMIAITVIAVIIAYMWVMGYFSSTTSKLDKAIQIQSASYTGSHLGIYVQNVGKGTVRFVPSECLYVDGVLRESASITPDTLQETNTATILEEISLGLSQTIKLKVVTDEGIFVEATVTIDTFSGDYTLTVLIIGSGNVTMVPSGSFYYYDNVQLTASPDPHWRFIRWEGDLSGSDNPEEIYVDRNRAVTAIFEQYQFQVEFGQTGLDSTATGTVVTISIGGNVYPKAFGDLPFTTEWLDTGTIVDYAYAAPTVSSSTVDKQFVYTGSTGPASPITVTQAETVAGNYGTQYFLTVSSPYGTAGGQRWYDSGATAYAVLDTGVADHGNGTRRLFTGWSGDASGTDYAQSNVVTMDAPKNAMAVWKTQHAVAFAVDPPGAGTTNPSGTDNWYDTGTADIPVSAASDPLNSAFVSWSSSTPDVVIDNVNAQSTTITVNGPGNVTATFTRIEYSLLVEWNPLGSGNVSMNNLGPYYYGDVVELTANPIAGWGFSQWSGDLSGSTNPTNVVIDGNKAVTATFTQESYTLTIVTVGSGSVVLDPPGGTYLSGTTVTLDAQPTVGWSFSGWSGDLTGSNDPETIIMDGPKTVTATFTQDEYTVTVLPTGNGHVHKDPNQTTYHYGDAVQLTSDADLGWTFTGWSGDLTGSTNPDSITVTKNMDIAATFTQDEYTLTVNIVGSGSVAKNPNQATYHYGDSVQLNATSDTGWTFSGWSGDLTGSTNPETIIMNTHRTVTATFTQNTYTIIVTVDGQGNVNRNASEPYIYGQAVNLTAVPTAGWSFQGWGGDLTGVTSNPATLIMTTNRAVTATFSQGIPGTIIFFDDFNDGYDPRWTLSGSITPDRANSPPAYPGASYYARLTGYFSWGVDGSITVTIPTTDYSSIQLSYWRIVQPFMDADYLRVEWRVGTGTWTNIEDYYTAAWAQKTYSFSASADDQSSMQIRFTIAANSMWDYSYVDDVLVTGTPMPPHAHVTFTQTGSSVAPTVNYQIESGGSGTTAVPFTVIVPVGKQISYTYQAEVPGATGTRYVYTGVNATSPLIVTNTNPVTISGSYKTQYKLTLATVPSQVGTSHIAALPSSGDGFYDSGTGVSLTADSYVTINATSRYRFTGWSGDAGGTSNTTSVTMSAARSVTANYVIQHQVSFAVNPVGSGTTNATGYYDTGSISISANANTGYVFSSWSRSGSISIPNPTANPTTATISGTGTVTANFVIPPHYVDTANAVHDANVGSHSSFANMQNDGSFDTLTESDVASTQTWVTPTGDSGSSWSNRGNAHDSNTGTYASASQSLLQWTGYLTLSYSSTTGTGVRYWVGRSSTDVNNMEVDVYNTGTSTWQNVYSGAPTVNQWINASFSSRTTNQIRFRFYVNALGSRSAYVYEAQVLSVAPANYQLDLEVQFSGVTNYANYTQLQIKTGAFSGENLAVYYWSGSWQLLTNSLTASTTNTFTVSLSGSTFELRFYDTTRTGDTNPDTWQIDYVRLVAP